MDKRKCIAGMFALALWMGATTSSSARGKAHHVLVMDYANHQFVYTVDGRVPKKKDGLLLTLSLAREADPRADAGIDVLVTSRARLSDVSNLVGMIIKADYSSWRVYVFDSDKQSMVELRYGETVPFPSMGK